MTHVYPVNDLHEHKLEGADCWCSPTIDEEDHLVIHNAELRGAKPTGEASRSNDVLGADTPERN